ncbi:arrestin domain-containing protein 3-like [Archocentrus centrarchus]|uniref:arrestin domain-containing protein 3-like n=1 Tax=Archocentrus centrarchus TaxID=63155 RepID=UPI0011EA4BE0|nr:arrestin domain-containing protein 3-like [Archocentrus centrarchus]
MSSSVKNFSVGYNPINKSNTFSPGDFLTGQITVELTDECKIQSLCVKLKGKAEVSWTENYGKTVVTYHSKDKFFSIKHFIIQESQGNNVIPQGCHVYPFSFQIPAQDLPSSFKGSWGKILYRVEANLSRSMRTDSKAKAEFTLIQKGNTDPVLMTPQHNMIDKKMKLFTSGSVAMDVSIPKTGFCQGEGIKVVASIQNKSYRDIKPKYCLYRKYSYFAKGKRRVETKDILKEEGEEIPSSAGQTVTKIIVIPSAETVSVLNCSIIKAEYRLRVYLDVKYASDPEIKFPIIILPASEGFYEEQPSDYLTNGFEAFPNAGMLGGMSFQQNPAAPEASAPPPSYGTYGLYPSLTGLDRKPI